MILGPNVEVRMKNGSIRRVCELTVGAQLLGKCEGQIITVDSIDEVIAPMYRVRPLWSDSFECGGRVVLEVSGTRADINVYTCPVRDAVVDAVVDAAGAAVSTAGGAVAIGTSKAVSTAAGPTMYTTTLVCSAGHYLPCWPWSVRFSWRHKEPPMAVIQDPRIGVFTGLSLLDAHITRIHHRLVHWSATGVSVSILARDRCRWSYGVVRNRNVAIRGSYLRVGGTAYARLCGLRLRAEWIEQAPAMDFRTRWALLSGVISRCGQLCTSGLDAPRHEEPMELQSELGTERLLPRAPRWRHYYRLTLTANLLCPVRDLCRSMGLVVWTTPLTENVLFIHSGPTKAFFNQARLTKRHLGVYVEPVAAMSIGPARGYRLTVSTTTPFVTMIVLADGVAVSLPSIDAAATPGPTIEQ